MFNNTCNGFIVIKDIVMHYKEKGLSKTSPNLYYIVYKARYILLMQTHTFISIQSLHERENWLYVINMY